MTQKITISVWETDAPVADSKWMACYDDYDLDCHTGTGHTPEEAIIELVSMWDLPVRETVTPILLRDLPAVVFEPPKTKTP